MSQHTYSEVQRALYEGMFAAPPWHGFLHILLARTGADRCYFRIVSEQPDALTCRAIAHGFEEGRGDASAEELAALGDLASTLRPNRVYALEELLDFDRADARRRQQELLRQVRIGDARLMRIPSGKSVAWLIVLHERPTFGAADSALLTNLAASVACVVEQWAALTKLRLRVAAAEGALERLGIAQAVLDANGHIFTSDQGWQKHIAAASTPMRLGEMPTRVRENLTAGACMISSETTPILLRRADERSATIAAIRSDGVELPKSASNVLMTLHGLTQREAALTVLLCRGMSLTDAATELHLTPETARNYSKRIFAKTGTRGQGDLIRSVLSTVAVLA